MISNCFFCLFGFWLFVCLFCSVKNVLHCRAVWEPSDLVVFCNKKVLYTLMVPLSLEKDLLIIVGRNAERLCNDKSQFIQLVSPPSSLSIIP